MITYNHEKFIRDAIEGVLIQKVNFEVELIIAYDNSPDNTESIVLDIASSHPNGKWIKYTKHKINKGMMPNFIWALQQCKGKYIALCEGDDYWTNPYKLQKQVDFLENNHAFSGSYHDTKVINEISGNEYLFRKRLSDFYSTIDTFSKNSIFHTSSFIFRKSALQLPEFLNNIISGDMSLFSIVSSSGNLGYVPGVMSVYRKNNSGITSMNLVKKTFHQDRIKLINCLNEYHNYRFDSKAKLVIHYHENEIYKSKLMKYFFGRLILKFISLFKKIV